MSCQKIYDTQLGKEKEIKRDIFNIEVQKFTHFLNYQNIPVAWFQQLVKIFKSQLLFSNTLSSLFMDISLQFANLNYD